MLRKHVPMAGSVARPKRDKTTVLLSRHHVKSITLQDPKARITKFLAFARWLNVYSRSILPGLQFCIGVVPASQRC
jgi:hypothetical protein